MMIIVIIMVTTTYNLQDKQNISDFETHYYPIHLGR